MSVIKVKRLLRNGSTAVDTFPTAMSFAVEDDGVDGRLLMLRDAEGRFTSSCEMELVLEVTGERA